MFLKLRKPVFPAKPNALNEFPNLRTYEVTTLDIAIIDIIIHTGTKWLKYLLRTHKTTKNYKIRKYTINRASMYHKYK